MSKKKALGQGLDALLGGDIDLDAPLVPENDSETKQENSEGVRYLPLERIVPNPDQPREHFDEEALAELAESIRQQGVIQPVLVERVESGNFQIVAGERRWRASQLAKLEQIPVLIRDFTPEQKLEIALVENIQREDLSPLEEARGYRHLMDALHLSQQEVADKVGKKRSTVANSLRLLKLPESMRDAVEKGQLTAGHARALLAVTNPADQDLLFGRIKEKGLSVREAESMATEMNRGHKGGEKTTPPEPKSFAPRDAEMASLEQKFIDVFGTRVTLRGTMERGKMEVSWFSPEDLNRIYEILVKDE